MVRLLLVHGANPNVTTYYEESGERHSPMQAATQSTDPTALMAELLKSGANPATCFKVNFSRSSLSIGPADGLMRPTHTTMMNDICAPLDGESPLHWAARAGLHELVLCLVAHNAPPGLINAVREAFLLI